MNTKVVLFTLIVVVLSGIKSFADETADYFEIAIAYYEEKQYAKAVETLLKKFESEDSFGALLLLPWILSTCPDDNIRNGRLAMMYAHKLHFQTLLFLASDIKQGKSDWLSNLCVPWLMYASAYAELAEFDSAVFCQKIALLLTELIKNVDRKQRLQKRMRAVLKLYQNGIPLRTNVISIGELSDAWIEKILNADDVRKIDFE